MTDITCNSHFSGFSIEFVFEFLKIDPIWNFLSEVVSGYLKTNTKLLNLINKKPRVPLNFYEDFSKSPKTNIDGSK